MLKNDPTFRQLLKYHLIIQNKQIINFRSVFDLFKIFEFSCEIFEFSTNQIGLGGMTLSRHSHSIPIPPIFSAKFFIPLPFHSNSIIFLKNK